MGRPIYPMPKSLALCIRVGLIQMFGERALENEEPVMDDQSEEGAIEVSANDTQFSVWVVYRNGEKQKLRGVLTSLEATKEFKETCACQAAKRGDIQRVLIVDGGDFVNADWQHGKGLVFPVEAPR